MAKYFYEPGEVRFVWLDEDGQRTSHYHKSISSAYSYRRILLSFLDGKPQWSPTARKPFEPQGTGKAPVRLVKVQFVMQEIELSDEDRLDVEAAERMAAAR